MSPIDEKRFKRYAEKKRFDAFLAAERPTDDYILELYASHTAPQIAEILRRPYNTVRMWIQEARTGRRHSGYRAKRCGR